MICTTKQASEYPLGSSENPHRFKTGIRWALLSKMFRSDGSPLDISGYTGKSELRTSPEDVGPPVAAWTVMPSATMTGQAIMMIGATVTQNILPGRYVFDLEYENNSDPDDVIVGTKTTQHVIAYAGVTKS